MRRERVPGFEVNPWARLPRDSEEAPVAEKAKKSVPEPSSPEVTRPPLKPIRVVRRRIECPDGGTVEVDVPVYPPFRFEIPEADSPARKPPKRSPRVRTAGRPPKSAAADGAGSKAGVEKKAKNSGSKDTKKSSR